MPFLSHRITEWVGREGTSEMIQFHPSAMGRNTTPGTGCSGPHPPWPVNEGRQGVKTNPDWLKYVWTLSSNLHKVSKTLHLAVKGQWHNQQESRSSEWDCTKHCRENTLYWHIASKSELFCPSGNVSFNNNLFSNESGTNGIETRWHSKGNLSLTPTFLLMASSGDTKGQSLQPPKPQQGWNHP